MAQERVQKQRGKAREEEVQAEEVRAKGAAELAEKTDETLASIDDVLEDQVDDELLAELDGVLEENAQEFVEAYVQQGGQ